MADERIAAFIDYENLAIGAREDLGIEFQFKPIADALAERGRVVVKHGVKLVGHDNMPSRLAEDASQMYAKNLLNFITPLVDGETKSLAIDWEDEIITGTLLTRAGKVIHPLLIG